MEPALLAVVAVAFLSALIRGLTGFGNALVAMPLLALFFPVRTATPVVALSATFMAIIMLARSWRQVDFRSARLLVAASVCGIPLGLMFIKGAHEALVQGVLGVLIGGFCIHALLQPRQPRIHSRLWALVAGFSAGVLGGAYNTNGPPVVIYGTMRRWPPEKFRATLQGFFLPTGVVILCGHFLAGLWTRQVMIYTMASIPALAVGLLASWRLAPLVPRDRFEKLVQVVLLLCALVLLVKAVSR